MSTSTPTSTPPPPPPIKKPSFEIKGLENSPDKEFVEILLQPSTVMETSLTPIPIFKKIILPGAHISRRTKKPTSIVYVIPGTVHPSHFLSHKLDLCAGESSYDVERLPTVLTDKTNALESWFESKSKTAGSYITFLSLYENRKIFREQCINSIVASVGTHGTVKDFVLPKEFTPQLFGTENCSISIGKTIDEDQVESYQIVIRNYDPISTQGLLHYIQSNPTLQVGELMNSPIYNQCIRNGDAIRDAIAFQIAKHLDLVMLNAEKRENIYGKQVSALTPTAVHHYNVLSNFNDDNHKWCYAFHDGCLNVSENQTSRVILGLGRHVGYQIYKCPTETRFGTSEWAFSFPLGVPLCKKDKIGILSTTTTTTTTLKPITTVSNQNKIYWGGPFEIHPKLLQTYDSDYAKTERKFLYKMLGLSPENHIDLKMVTKCAIIESPIEEELGIESVFELNKKTCQHPNLTLVTTPKSLTFAQDLVRVPVGDSFIEKDMMKCFLAFLKRSTLSNVAELPQLSDLVPYTDSNFFYFHRPTLELILKYKQQRH